MFELPQPVILVQYLIPYYPTGDIAKLLQENPTLMRLRELEVLEKVAASAKLNVVLGDKGLTERVVNVL